MVQAIVSTRNTQSLTDFRQRAAATLRRINKTGEAEILTVNGEARAVLLAPAAYDELTREAQLTADAEVIRRSIRELREGKGQELHHAFGDIRKRVLAQASRKSRSGKRK